MSSQTSDELDVTRWFKDELQCNICKNLLSNPRSLNCFHLFCLECLENRVYNLKQNCDELCRNLRCPSCEGGTAVDSPESLYRLKTDLSVKRLLESLQGLGLIGHDGLSEKSFGSRVGFGQSLMTSSDATSIDSVEFPSFVTSVGSESSMSFSFILSGDLTASLPRGDGKIVSDHGVTRISGDCHSDSIRSLRSSGFERKSPIAPNQIQLRPDSYDSDNLSLAISSERNTATTKSTTDDDVVSMGTSSGHQRSYDDSENEPVNIKMERRCPMHPEYLSTIYCLPCKLVICQKCKEEEHHGHEIGDLQAEADRLRCELITMIKDATEGLTTVGKAQKTLRSQRIFDIHTLENQLNVVEEQIKANAQALIAQIEKDSEMLLDEVKRLRQASNVEVLNTLEKDMRTGRRIATVVNRRGDAVDVVNTSRAICKKMHKATGICASGGAIDRIRELSVRFCGNRATDLAVGQLQENIEWKLSHQLPIPFDKRGCMQGMVSLRDGRLAVGYGGNNTGGIDIFSTMGKQDGPLSRILEGIELVDLASTLDDTIIVYPIYGEITEVTPAGKERPKRFAAPSSTQHVSMSSSIDGRIFLGYAEHGEIHQFQQSGGNPLKSISMDHCQPQQIDVTASGKVVVKDRSGVKVLDPTTNAITDIFKVGKEQFAYSTCDINDNVYVAKVSATGRYSKASIDKYNLDGSLLEPISRDLEMSRNHKGDHWLRLVSLSPFKLAVCDGSLISIYQRQPSVIELANDLGL